MAPLFRGADGLNCKDIINGIAFSMPSCLCPSGHCNFSSYCIIIVLLYSIFIGLRLLEKSEINKVRMTTPDGLYEKTITA